MVYISSFRLIIFILTIGTLLQISQTITPVPIAAHQFKMVWSTKKTSSTNPNSLAFTFPLSASYDSSYTRYLVLAGYQIFLPNYVSFQLISGGSSPTTQTISVLPVNTAFGFFQVSVYVLCVSSTTSSYLWVLDQNYMNHDINTFNIFGGALVETVNLTPPIIIEKSSDFQVYPFITWYRATGIFNGPCPCRLDAQIFTGPSPPMVQITFTRGANGNQITQQVKFIAILVNTSRLLFENAPFYLGSSGIATNLGINSIFKSNTYSGLDGNCLIGVQKLQVGGNYWGGSTRKVMFDAKLYPSLNVETTVRNGDTFSVAFSIFCFNFAVPCATLTYFNPNTLTCGPCAITNCTTCLLYNYCQICDQYSGWVLSAIQCQYCPNIAPGCLECLNSTYCTSCLDNSYSLQNNSCLSCSESMVGCYQCTNDSYCLSCLNTSYVYNPTSHLCPPCSSALDYCYQCTNLTVCISCAMSYFMNTTVFNGSTSTICSPCGVPLSYCGQCSNDSVCEVCLPSYFLANNTCFGCDHFLPNCQTCSSQTVCTACVATYYLLGTTTCNFCFDDNPLCIQCINPQMCTLCIAGYYSSTITASNYTCLSCTTLTNCFNCTDSVTCVECQPTYLLSGTVCLSCGDFLANCQTCDNSTYCTGCVSDYFYPHLGFCIPCSASIMYCNSCVLNATTNETAICTSCTDPLFLNNQSECQTCGSAIDNCALCTNDTYCLDCVSNKFAYDSTNNSCLPCSQLFQNCSTCTIQMCTQCQPDFSLINNNQNCTCMIGTLVRGICSAIVGCVVPTIDSNGKVQCLMCDNTTFFVTPVYNHCQCLRGTLIGTVCSTIPNCIAAIIALNGDILCAFCNVNGGFLGAPINNIECICKPSYVSNGTHCNQICGDGLLMTKVYACDDGNANSGDGCSSQCEIEVGYQCSGGNTTSASVCYYIGSKVTLSLNLITKSRARNEAVFKFDVHPGIEGIGRMDLMNNVHLNCDGNYSVSSISYQSGQLTIKADYTTDLEGAHCSVSMSFQKNIVRSPTAKLKFSAKSNNYPLNLTLNFADIEKLSFIFVLLAYISLGVFVLSLTHKMIGAELLVCCQIVFLSNCFYKIPSIQFSTVSELGLVTGDWTFFYQQNDMMLNPPFTNRVQISPQFLQSTLFIVGAFALMAIVWFLLIVISIVRQQLSETKQKQGIPSRKQTEASFSQKASKILYRSFAFPFIAGLFISLCIAGYIYNLRLQSLELGQFSGQINCLTQLFVWMIVGMTLGIEVCSHMAFQGSIFLQFFGVEDSKQWYIPIFLIRTVILTVLIEVGITFSFDLILYAIAGVNFIYLIVIVIGRPYKGWCDRIGSTLCVIAECYSIGLPLTMNFLIISDRLIYILILAMFGLLFGSISFALIRLFFVYRTTLVSLCSKIYKVINKRKKSKKIQEQQKMNKKMGNPFSILQIRDQYKGKNGLEFQKNEKLTPLVTFQNVQDQNANDFEDQEILKIKDRLKQNLMRKKMRLSQNVD